MIVPFLDLGAAVSELRDELDAAWQRVADSGWFITGDELRAFETAFAEQMGGSHCVGVGSGLDALHLGLRALGVGPGDEVIVPSHTFVATWLAVTHAGATPVPVEPVLETGLLDPRRIEAALTPRTRCIVPVHLYGQPADMVAITTIAERHGLRVLSDAAQAHGARDQGHPLGELGDACAYSFYPGKNLGAFGDGGALVSNDPEVAARVRKLRNYGSVERYHHQEIGFNSRLDELQAAFLSVRLRHLDSWNARRRAHARRYLERLSESETLSLPVTRAGAEHVWHLFVVRSPRRDALLAHLHGHGVGAQLHYPVPPHRSGAYLKTHGNVSLANAERLADEVLSLPIGPHLTTDQAEHVIEVLLGFDGK